MSLNREYATDAEWDAYVDLDTKAKDADSHVDKWHKGWSYAFLLMVFAANFAPFNATGITAWVVSVAFLLLWIAGFVLLARRYNKAKRVLRAHVNSVYRAADQREEDRLAALLGR